MALLRHEAGHAVNYAYRLWRRPSWEEIFGRFHRPYRDYFSPDHLSREYVRHISVSPYGRTYAQKHPDEDFAETFAVWLTPRSGWRARYRNWPVMRKLLYVNGLMKEIRRRSAENSRVRFLRPVESMTMLLADHYGKKAKRYRRAARGYVDDRLREVFPPTRGTTAAAGGGIVPQAPHPAARTRRALVGAERARGRGHPAQAGIALPGPETLLPPRAGRGARSWMSFRWPSPWRWTTPIPGA